MAKDLPGAVDAEIAAAKSRPVLLFTIGLDVGSLRFCNTKTNIVFPTGGGGDTYTAKTIQLGNMRQSRDNQIGKVTVAFDDVARDMSGYNNAEKFEGKSFDIWKVYRDALGNATFYNELFSGYLLEPKNIDYKWMAIDVVNGSILQQRNLLHYYQEKLDNRESTLSAYRQEGLFHFWAGVKSLQI